MAESNISEGDSKPVTDVNRVARVHADQEKEIDDRGTFRLMGAVKCLSVEPALFLYMISSFLHLPVFQALIYDKACLNLYAQNSELCSNSTATHNDRTIQTESNFVFMLSSICFSVPSFVATIFLGSYGDRRSRKIALLLPYVGLALADVNYIIQATYMNYNVYYLLISDVLFAIFGGYSGIIATSFSYGAQMTAFANRSYRMAFLEGSIGAGGTIGYLFSGIILHAVGYRSTFLINMALHCTAFFYICLFTTDSADQIEKRRRKQGSECMPADENGEGALGSGENQTATVNNGVDEEEEHHQCCWSWLFAYFRDAVSVLKKRSGDGRVIIITILAAFSVSFLVFSGSQDIMFYYLKHELNWSSATYGVFRGVYFGSSSAMILFLYPLLRYRGVSDWALAAVGLLSRLIGSFMLCFPFSTWFVFSVSIVYMFNRFAATGLRSIASKQVEKDEQGKIFAAIALIEAACSLLASVIFNNLYSLSLTFFPGFCYALMSGLMVIPLSLILFVGRRLKYAINGLILLLYADVGCSAEIRVREMCSVRCKRIIALVIGILDMLVAGSIYSYNIYAPSMQMTFNFTQEEIDTIPSFGHMGFCIGIPAGYLRSKCGSTLMSAAGFVVSTTGYLLIWSTFLSKYAYHYKSWLMSVYYFFVGHGLVYLYMEALVINMKNMPKRHRGAVVGCLDAVLGASGSIFVLIYKLAFARTFWSTHEEQQNLMGFILFLSACCAFVGITSVVGLREYRQSTFDPASSSHAVSIPDVREYTAPAYEYPRNDSESSSVMADDDDDLIPIVGTRPRLRIIGDQRSIGGVSEPRRSSSPDSDDDVSRNVSANAVGIALLKSAKFHCLVWPFILTGGVCFVVITNIEFILKSVRQDEYILTALVAAAVSNGVTRVLCGVISDRYVNSVPRTNVWFFTLTPLLVTSGFVVFYMEEVFMLILWCVALGAAYGSLWCLVPTIMSESYGMKYFGVNWGSTLFVSALFSFGLQRLFGYFYDLHVPAGALLCEGVQCFRLSFLVFTSLVFVSMTLIVALSKLTQSNEN